MGATGHFSKSGEMCRLFRVIDSWIVWVGVVQFALCSDCFVLSQTISPSSSVLPTLTASSCPRFQTSVSPSPIWRFQNLTLDHLHARRRVFCWAAAFPLREFCYQHYFSQLTLAVPSQAPLLSWWAHGAKAPPAAVCVYHCNCPEILPYVIAEPNAWLLGITCKAL